MATKKINVLAYDGCMGMGAFGLCDTLLLGNRVHVSARTTLRRLKVHAARGPVVGQYRRNFHSRVQPCYLPDHVAI